MKTKTKNPIPLKNRLAVLPWATVTASVLMLPILTLPGFPGVHHAGVKRSGINPFTARISSVLAPDSTAQTSTDTMQFIPLPVSNLDLDGLADRGAPKGRRAAGTRGPCLLSDPAQPISMAQEHSHELTILVPTVTVAYDEPIPTPMGITARTHPNFLFYMPYTQATVEALQFTLLDADDALIASVAVAVPDAPGILHVQWPQDQTPLQSDSNYRWLLHLDWRSHQDCSNAALSPSPLSASASEAFETDLVVEGFIRRVILTPEQSQQLARVASSSLESVDLLASFGIWNDAFNTLWTLQQAEPLTGTESNAIAFTIDQLLSSVGLDEFSAYFDNN